MLTIHPIPAFSDNYIWLLSEENRHWVVDPGDAEPVVAALQGRSLDGILVTHHHWDHTGGIEALVQRYQCPVYGPGTITGITHALADGDTTEVLGHPVEVTAVPGHTLDHIAYLLTDTAGDQHLFCGDTLFAAGCGRLFEGTPSQMYQSLSRLGSLATSTRVYCAHEYTLGNLRFAAAVEPGNPDIEQRTRASEALRAAGEPTLPSNIGTELSTNPFLRCHINDVAAAAVAHSTATCPTPTDVFAALRQWKDDF